MIKTLIFDLGGVLIDLNREESVRRFVHLGISDADEMLDPYLQKGPFLGIEDGSISTDQFEAILSQRCGRSISYGDVYYALMGFLAEVSEEKLRYIQSLKKQYRIVILSNTNPYIRAFSRSIQFTTHGLPLDAFVHQVYASYEMRCVKPHEEIFGRLLLSEGLDPKNALFVDDSIRNVETAALMGMHTLCPVNGEDWRAEVERILGTNSPHDTAI